MYESLREQFNKDGAVLLENCLNQAQLAQCRAIFDYGVKHPGPMATQLETGSDQRTLNDNANPNLIERCNELVKTLPLAKIFSEVWGSKHVWYFAEELFGKEGGTPGRSMWHQDTAYLPWGGEHWANAWISFEPVPKRNALEIVRGSHHGTLYDGTTFMNPDDPTDPLHGYDQLPRLPDIEAVRTTDPDAFDIISWATQPGDVVALHPGSLHGGAPVDSAAPDRHTLVLRFFGDDAVFRALPGKSRSRYTPAGVLHLEHIAHLNEGDPYRSPFYVQLV